MVNIISYTTCHPALDCSVSDRLASPMSETSCYADLVSASRKPRRCVLRMLVTPVLPEGRELVQQLTRNVAVSMGLPGPQTSLLPVVRSSSEIYFDSCICGVTVPDRVAFWQHLAAKCWQGEIRYYVMISVFVIILVLVLLIKISLM